MNTIGFFCKSTDNSIYDAADVCNSTYELKKQSWIDSDKNNIVIEQECDWINIDCLKRSGNVIEIDNIKYRSVIKELHKDSVNKAADTIRDGWLLCDTDPTPGAPHRNKSFLAIKSNREILTEKQKVVADKSTEVAAEFPTIWVKTGKGDADRYSIEVSEIAPMYYAVEFTTQALVNIEIEVQNLILADFENPEIDIATFKETDYVNMSGGFMELFSTKTADAKVFAQPEDSPTAI
jgi:hypothetical protein